MGQNKYRNVPTEVEGILFQSMHEARRYQDLRLLERAGQISGLETQPKYIISVNGVRICSYSADFRYVENGQVVVEDAKSGGTRTPQYRLKVKLMKAVHGITIRET